MRLRNGTFLTVILFGLCGFISLSWYTAFSNSKGKTHVYCLSRAAFCSNASCSAAFCSNASCSAAFCHAFRCGSAAVQHCDSNTFCLHCSSNYHRPDAGPLTQRLLDNNSSSHEAFSAEMRACVGLWVCSLLTRNANPWWCEVFSTSVCLAHVFEMHEVYLSLSVFVANLRTDAFAFLSGLWWIISASVWLTSSNRGQLKLQRIWCLWSMRSGHDVCVAIKLPELLCWPFSPCLLCSVCVCVCSLMKLYGYTCVLKCFNAWVLSILGEFSLHLVLSCLTLRVVELVSNRIG